MLDGESERRNRERRLDRRRRSPTRSNSSPTTPPSSRGSRRAARRRSRATAATPCRPTSPARRCSARSVMVAKQQNEARGAKVTPEIEAAARDDVESQLGSMPSRASPPRSSSGSSTRTRRSHAHANVAGSALDDAALQKVFTPIPHSSPRCAPARAREHARGSQRHRKRLANGEDFGTVAKEVSIDTGSAPNGGDLGCSPAASP